MPEIMHGRAPEVFIHQEKLHQKNLESYLKEPNQKKQHFIYLNIEKISC
jgi:hypothetical protein